MLTDQVGNIVIARVCQKVVSCLLPFLLAFLFPATANADLDFGEIEIGYKATWDFNISLENLRADGCTAECEIDSISVENFGPGDTPRPSIDLEVGQVRLYSEKITISGESSPRNIGAFGFRLEVVGGCSAHNHPHVKNIGVYTFHGVAPKIQLQILSAVMRDVYTFDVHIYRDFGNGRWPVVVKYQVNGVPFTIPKLLGSSGQRSGSLGQYVSDPVSDTFLNRVPKFRTAQTFTVEATVKIKEWEFTTRRQATIPLPTVIVPGAQPYLHLSTTGGNTSFPDLVAEIIDAVKDGNEGLGDSDSMMFGDERLIRLPGQATPTRPFYPILQTIDFRNAEVDRNSCTLAQGGTFVNRTVAALLRNTWASRVNLISHSKGCLTARAALSQNSGLRRTVANFVMIEGPHAGMPLFLEYEIANLPFGWFSNLLPSPYNSYKGPFESRFRRWPTENRELVLLNARRLPAGPNYIVYYSDSYKDTLWAVNYNLTAKRNVYGPGDERVPLFSQKGQGWDANRPKRAGRMLPAFRGVAVHYRSVPGEKTDTSHGRTMTNQGFIQELVSLLYR